MVKSPQSQLRKLSSVQIRRLLCPREWHGFVVKLDMQYEPPFKITARAVSLIADICKMLGRIEATSDADSLLRLRRINQIRTIQGSLAIEGNTLSIEQITAILEGKKVIAPPREIQEARNAIKAYEMLGNWQPHSAKDLLHAHEVLMTSLVDDPGAFRKKGVGVMAGERIIHMAPAAWRIPELMQSLLLWLPVFLSPVSSFFLHFHCPGGLFSAIICSTQM